MTGCATTPSEKRIQSIYEDGKKALAQGNTEIALQKFQTALSLSEKRKFQEGIASNLHGIALTHVQKKEWRQGLQFMERALAADRRVLEEAKKVQSNRELDKVKIRIAEAKVSSDLNDLARLHLKLGEREAALKRLGELLTIDLRLGRELGAAITHNNIARVFLEMSNFEKARRHYLVALGLFRKLRDEKRTQAVRRNLILLERLKRRRFPDSPS